MIILPEEVKAIGIHNDVMPVFSKVGLEAYFSLPAWGIYTKRSYQLLTTLEVDGTAKVDGPDDVKTTVVINEDLIRDALKVPKGNINLLTKNTHTEINKTFMLLRHADYTYKDLIRVETEIPLRLYMQHFQQGRAVRYTWPN